MQLVLWGSVFLVAVLTLVMSAEHFTRGAEEVGLYLGMPAYVVGVTIVAIGTSLPELISSVFAVTQGSPEIVIGNVVGSNITNIFLVLGIAAILGRRLEATYEIIHVDLPMLVASAALVVFVAYDGVITRPEALLCGAGAVVYLLYAINISLSRGRTHEDIEDDIEEELRVQKGRLDPRVWVRLALGSIFLYFAAEYTVRSVIELSTLLDVGTEIIAISAVALGTSLPELTVSIIASRRGNLEIAIGNVLGSSVFNAFAVIGVSGLLVALPVPSVVVTLGLPVMLGASLLYFFMAQDKEITRWEGWLLVIFYVAFIGKLFGLI